MSSFEIRAFSSRLLMPEIILSSWVFAVSFIVS
nr:MAG TPA: hypothetical protein [Caudoviricetes sp.]